MDFIKTIIRVDDVVAFKKRCTPQNFQNVLQRLKMNTAFVIMPRTKPNFFLIDLDNLMYDDGPKIFNVLMNSAQFIRDDSPPSGRYWLVQFYVSSLEKNWNDQRMYYYEQNRDRFQTILELPCLSQNSMTYVEGVAYYSKSPEGQNYPLFRAGQNIITPLLEYTPYQRIQTYVNNLSALKVQDGLGVDVYRSNSNPATTTTTSPEGWKNWNNKLTILWDNYFLRPLCLFYIVVPDQDIISLVTQLIGDFDEDVRYIGLEDAFTPALNTLVSKVNNKSFLANIFNPFEPPSGLQGYNTLGSGANMITDLMTYLGCLDMEGVLPFNYYPIKTPVALQEINTFLDWPPKIRGYLETFAYDPTRQYLQMDLDPRIQDSILSLQEHPDLINTFNGATSIIRLGTGNICNFLLTEEFGPFLRSEVYYFNLSRYSEYVEIFVEGIEEPNYVDFEKGYQITLGGALDVLLDTSDEKLWDWYEYIEDTYTYQVTNLTEFDRNGPIDKTKPEDVIVIPTLTNFLNNNLTYLRNYSPNGGQSLGQRYNWYSLRKAYFNNLGYNVYPTSGSSPLFTGITEIFPSDGTLYTNCNIRVALIPAFDEPPNSKEWWGLTINGPVGPFFEVLKYPSNSYPVDFGMLRPNRVELYKVYNDTLQQDRMQRVATGFALDDPNKEGDTFCCGNYVFTNWTFTTTNVIGYLVWVSNQGNANPERQYVMKGLEPTFVFGKNINLSTILGNQTPPVTNGFNVCMVPSISTLCEGNPDLHSYSYSFIDPGPNNIGCRVGMPGRLIQEYLDVPAIFGKLNLRISSNWTESRNLAFWSKFKITNSTYRRLFEEDQKLFVGGQDMGLRYFRDRSVENTFIWDTRNGRRDFLVDFQSSNSDTYLTSVIFQDGHKNTTGQFPNAFSGVLPFNNSVPESQSFQLRLYPVLTLEAGKSFGASDGNSVFGKYEISVAGENVVILGKNWLNPLIGKTIELFVEINFTPTSSDDIILLNIVRTYKQSIKFDTVVEIKGWTAYTGDRFERGWSQISRNPFNRNNIFFKYLFLVPNLGDATNQFLTMTIKGNTSPINANENVVKYFYRIVGDTTVRPPILSPNLNNAISLGIPNYQALGGDWFSDTQDDPAYFIGILRSCTAGPNDIEITVLSGPNLGVQNENRFFGFGIYTWRHGITNPIRIFNKTLQFPYEGIPLVQRLNLNGVFINPTDDRAFIRFAINKKADYYPTQPPNNFIIRPTFIGTRTDGSTANIVETGDPDSFSMSKTFRQVIRGKETFLIKVANQDEGDYFQLQTTVVDLDQPSIINNETFYEIVYSAIQTEPINVDIVSLNINFSAYGWVVGVSNWGYAVTMTIFESFKGVTPGYQNILDVGVNPDNTLFGGNEKRIYLETPITNVWNYYSTIYLNNPKSVKFWIEFNLLLFGGKRDYIWDQFKHICAAAYKEADFPKISNMMVLCNACDNKGYGNVINFLLYNCYNGEERFFWQKFVKKVQANFYISFCPLASSPAFNTDFLYSDSPVWDIELNRYLTIYFK